MSRRREALYYPNTSPYLYMYLFPFLNTQTVAMRQCCIAPEQKDSSGIPAPFLSPLNCVLGLCSLGLELFPIIHSHNCLIRVCHRQGHTVVLLEQHILLVLYCTHVDTP